MAKITTAFLLFAHNINQQSFKDINSIKYVYLHISHTHTHRIEQYWVYNKYLYLFGTVTLIRFAMLIILWVTYNILCCTDRRVLFKILILYPIIIAMVSHGT